MVLIPLPFRSDNRKQAVRKHCKAPKRILQYSSNNNCVAIFSGSHFNYYLAKMFENKIIQVNWPGLISLYTNTGTDNGLILTVGQTDLRA